MKTISKVFKKILRVIALLLPCLISVFIVNTTHAVSFGTSNFSLNYQPSSGSSYTVKSGILYGYSQRTELYQARWYQFNSAPVVAQGNYANLHFETNVVGSNAPGGRRYFSFVNLPYMSVKTCSSTNGPLTILSSSLSTVITPWEDSTSTNSTLTVYGDISLSGFTSGSSYSIYCIVGSTDYSFFARQNLSNTTALWFEQNPMSITWTNDSTQSLVNSLNASNSQNTQAINNQTEQQQQQYDQEKQEESERENQQQADSETAQGVFGGLSLSNPFDSIFNLSGSCPKSIPILSGMLGRSDSTLVCFFPDSVSYIVTPIVCISETMLLFGFAVRWLNKSDEVAV